MIGSLGATELLIILAIVALLFGASRLTDLGSSLGKGIREFRQEVRKGDEEDSSSEGAAAGSTDASKPSEDSSS